LKDKLNNYYRLVKILLSNNSFLMDYLSFISRLVDSSFDYSTNKIIEQSYKYKLIIWRYFNEILSLIINLSIMTKKMSSVKGRK
jgi:hypothetical protein